MRKISEKIDSWKDIDPNEVNLEEEKKNLQKLLKSEDEIEIAKVDKLYSKEFDAIIDSVERVKLLLALNELREDGKLLTLENEDGKGAYKVVPILEE